MFLSLTLFLSAACKETIKSLSDLTALRSELIREYKQQDVSVVIQNSSVLGISFNNSSFNNLSESERATKAGEIALFAKNHFASSKTIEKIGVAFVSSQNYIFFNFSNTIGVYLFETEALGSPMKSDGKPKGDAVASYNPSANETNIYLARNIQLVSESGKNIMLLPHFSISGNNVTAPKLRVPETVLLDFTTFSDKRMFPEAPLLTIYVDGNKVFSGEAKLTNVMGSKEEKSFNEFLTNEISYDQFRQITDGKKAELRLGTKRFELTAEDLKALQSMRACVEKTKC